MGRDRKWPKAQVLTLPIAKSATRSPGSVATFPADTGARSIANAPIPPPSSNVDEGRVSFGSDSRGIRRFGTGLGAATAILEEIHRAGCNGAACHAQMYTMGAVLRHGSSEQKAKYLPEDRLRRVAAAGLRRHRTNKRHRHDAHPHLRAPRGRPLHRQRPEDLDQPRRTFRPDAVCFAARRRARIRRRPPTA